MTTNQIIALCLSIAALAFAIGVRVGMGWVMEECKNLIRMVSKWISVDDRLPDVSGLYIVCCNDEGLPSGEGIWYASGVIVCADTYVDKNGRVTWSWCEGATEYDLDGIVTHWMPLPEPPAK